ncbi:hypothetical protein M2284_004311 [Rhodococcus sp. LBL1]|nr:hypothetical protein [Rhodococcus sp. LBL1]MDH6684916.1 hypothetical protein [Rhodococcus sp. LBL2]
MTMSPWAVANLGTVFLELGELCKSIPLDAPWEAKHAAEWDRITLAKWLDDNVLSKPAHELLEMAIAGCYTSAASEVSFLFVLYQMASGGGPGFVLGVKDAAQDRVRSVGWGRSTGPWRPTWADPSTSRSRCARSRRTTGASPSRPISCRFAPGG